MAKKVKAAVKPLTYALIPADSDMGRPMYERLYQLVDGNHDDLSLNNVRIALAWATSWKPDVDGRLVLGKCKKASELDRELAPFDFCILLNKDFWTNPRVTNEQRDALLDHELMHAAVAYDEDGHAKRDERGRTVYRTRKHDIEEFSAIVRRYGCYKADLEEFARAIHVAEAKTAVWVSYTRLRDVLLEVGVTLPLERIGIWSDTERREVMTWALLRQGAGEKANLLSPSVPAVLAAALSEKHGPPADTGITATH